MSVVSTINELIKERGKPQQITELLVTDVEIVKFTPEVAALLEKCKKVEVLELSSCRLESLELLPNFPKLKVADLSDNKLTDKDLEIIAKMKSLNQVFLERNSIERIESLDALKDLPDLERLELGGNPVVDLPDYRQKVMDA